MRAEMMPQAGLPGVYVTSLFKILRLLEVPQKTVCQLLEVAKPTVSAWATGARPMPQRHYWRFCKFVSKALDDARSRLSAIYDEVRAKDRAEVNAKWHAFEAAMARMRSVQGSTPWEALSLEQQETIRQVFWPELDHIGFEEAVDAVIQRLEARRAQRHAFVEQVTQLLNEWLLETRQEEVYREIWEQCQLVGAYGRLDFDKFRHRVHSHPGERTTLRRAANLIANRARHLDRIAAPPGPERLSAQVDALKPPATQAQEVMEQGNTHHA
jgi:hypothetical protein